MLQFAPNQRRDGLTQHIDKDRRIFERRVRFIVDFCTEAHFNGAIEVLKLTFINCMLKKERLAKFLLNLTISINRDVLPIVATLSIDDVNEVKWNLGRS